MKVKKFICWGLEMYSHTHAYIHYGFSRVAKDAMGWDVDWVPDTLDSSNKYKDLDLTDYLFLTVGGSCKFMPHHPSAYYVLHNVDQKDYPKNVDISHLLALQVFTKDVYKRKVIELNVDGQPQPKANVYHYWQENGNCLYFCWATDLTPAEIENNITNLPTKINSRDHSRAIFIGTVASKAGEEFGNFTELTKFRDGFQRLKSINNNYFETRSNMLEDHAIDYIQRSGWAPTLVGTWQKEKGYIPCRIFKAMSYGHLGVTNSKEAFNCTGKFGLYDPDEFQLGDVLASNTNEKFRTNNLTRIINGMKYIQANHTYVNRLQCIMAIFDLKKNIIQQPIMKLKDKLTIITTVSPTKLNPSTKILQQSIESLNRVDGLLDCHHIIVFDGIDATSTSHAYCCKSISTVIEDYKQYKANVQKLVLNHPSFKNIQLLHLDTFMHQSLALKEAMMEVKTPFIYVREANIGISRTFPVMDILTTMEDNPNVKLIRACNGENHPNNWDGPIDDLITGDITNVPLVKTFRFSDSDHFTTVKFYQDKVFPKAKGRHFSEHWVMEPDFKQMQNEIRLNHNDWGMYLYGKLYEPTCLQHLDNKHFQ